MSVLRVACLLVWQGSPYGHAAMKSLPVIRLASRWRSPSAGQEAAPLEDHLHGAKQSDLSCSPESAVVTAYPLTLQPQAGHSATVWRSSRHQQGPCLHQGYQDIRWPGMIMRRTGLRRGLNGLPFRQGSTERIARKVQGLQGAHVLPLRRQGPCNGACIRLHQRVCEGAT